MPLHSQLLRAAAIAATAISLNAQAHQIWLEPDGKNASVLRFGEFHLNLREVSPGHLDGFTATRATLHGAQGQRTIALTKAANGLRIAAHPKAGETLTVQDDQFPLHSWEQGGKTTTGWFHFAARLIADEAAQSPSMTLDITPTGQNPGQYRLTFQGKPLPKTKVQIVTQSGWMQEKNTDAAGLVQFPMPWRGPYVLEASHMIPGEGERDGKKYHLTGYVTTLTWVKPQGIAAIDAPPPLKPGADH